MLWLCTFQMSLIIYVSLLMLTPKVLSVPFDPQDNDFLSWAHSYATFHNQSDCWVCGTLPLHQRKSSHGIDISTSRKRLFLSLWIPWQQSYVMPLLHLMTSKNPKMDWCNTLHFNYGHNETFNSFFNFLFFFLIFKIFNSYMRSQTWTPLPPPSPQHLSGSSPCTSPKHAAPCIRPRLAIQQADS